MPMKGQTAFALRQAGTGKTVRELCREVGTRRSRSTLESGNTRD